MSSNIKIIVNKKKQDPIIALVSMGFVVFSPFGTILIMDYLGFPLSLPELLFIPYLFIFRKRYIFSPVGKMRVIVFISLWILMIFISILAQRYSLIAVISSSRTYLTLIIAYLIFSKKNNVSLDDIMYISLGATLGWLYSSVYGINLYLEGTTGVVSRVGNMIAIPLLISISVLKKHNKTLLLAIILCIAISITAGLRRQIAVFLASLFLTYGILFFKNFKKNKKQFFELILIILLFLTVLPQISNYVKENIPVLYFRVFQKSENFLKGENDQSGDSIRLENMSYLIRDFSDYIIPKGFISRRTIEDGTGNFIDFPLLELFYMFGFLLALILLLVFGIQTFRCYKQSLKTNNDSLVFVILSIIMFMLLFLEGTFLSSAYVAPFTGYCLGQLKYHSKLTFVLGSKERKIITNNYNEKI